MRRMTGAAAVAALTLALASCGDDAGGADTIDGGGAITVSDEKGGGAELFAAMVAAVEEAGSYAFELDMDFQGQQMSSSGAATYGTDLAGIDMTMTMQMPLAELGEDGTGEFTVLLVDGRYYMSFPPEAGMPTNRPWLTIDPAGDDPVSQAFGDFTEQFGDSLALQQRFEEHAESITVEEVGPDTVDGVEVTEYVLEIDPADAAAVLNLPPAEELPFDELAYTIWVDSDSLPRRMSSDFGAFGSMEMNFSDFGEPVVVEAPPADEITDFDSMMDELGSVEEP